MLTLEPEKVDKLPLSMQISEPIPTKREEKIIFHANGVPVEKDLILNALRAEERPVVTVYKYDNVLVIVALQNIPC